MNKNKININFFFIFFALLFSLNSAVVYAEDEKVDAVIDQLQILTKDLMDDFIITLEDA